MMELEFFTGTHLGCMTSEKDDSMSLDCATIPSIFNKLNSKP
jgi:hypothetical protein